MSFTICPSSLSDIANMVKLSADKRLFYENAQPRFWRRAVDADNKQAKWFQELLSNPDYIMLCAYATGVIQGFIIGQIISVPAVYDPGGLTVMVDDFCVVSPSMWTSVGSVLISDLKTYARQKGATQIIVVCGAHDSVKQRFIHSLDLSIASEWYCGII